MSQAKKQKQRESQTKIVIITIGTRFSVS